MFVRVVQLRNLDQENLCSCRRSLHPKLTMSAMMRGNDDRVGEPLQLNWRANRFQGCARTRDRGAHCPTRSKRGCRRVCRLQTCSGGEARRAKYQHWKRKNPEKEFQFRHTASLGIHVLWYPRLTLPIGVRSPRNPLDHRDPAIADFGEDLPRETAGNFSEHQWHLQS